MNDILSTTEVAVILGVTRVRVWQLIQEKALEARRVGHIWVVIRESVAAYQEKKKNG